MYDYHSQTWPCVIVKPAKLPRSSSTGATYRRKRCQSRPDATAISDPQRQRVETPVYQGSEIPHGLTSPTLVSLRQTSRKDYTAATPGCDDSFPPNSAPGNSSATAGGYATGPGRTVIPTQIYKNHDTEELGLLE